MSDAVEIVDCEGSGRMVALVGSQLTASPAEDEVCVQLLLETSSHFDL